MKTKTIASLLAGVAVLSSQANAAILFSDDFSGAGDQSGTTVNTTWTGSGTGWATGSDWGDDIVYGNTAGTAVMSGGELILTNGNQNNTNTRAHRQLGGAGIITINTSTDIWFSANVAYTGASTQNAWFGISFWESYAPNATSGNNPSGSPALFFGADTASNVWEITNQANVDTESSINHYSTNSVFLVARIQDDKVDMWINPSDTSSQANLIANSTLSATTVASLDGLTFNAMRIGAGTDSNANGLSQITMGNMIAADTFAEAIPEPSTSLLVAFAASALFLRRRRA